MSNEYVVEDIVVCRDMLMRWLCLIGCLVALGGCISVGGFETGRVVEEGRSSIMMQGSLGMIGGDDYSNVLFTNALEWRRGLGGGFEADLCVENIGPVGIGGCGALKWQWLGDQESLLSSSVGGRVSGYFGAPGGTVYKSLSNRISVPFGVHLNDQGFAFYTSPHVVFARVWSGGASPQRQDFWIVGQSLGVRFGQGVESYFVEVNWFPQANKSSRRFLDDTIAPLFFGVGLLI